jgi:hypothetical protein
MATGSGALQLNDLMRSDNVQRNTITYTMFARKVRLSQTHDSDYVERMQPPDEDLSFRFTAALAGCSSKLLFPRALRKVVQA